MKYIKINKLITKSIYKQIATSISKAIDSGLLKYNDKLPTEKEICESFSISNTAVKMAYEKLILEGKIKRIKGKGTYVTNRLTYKTKLLSYYQADVLESDSHKKYINDIILIGRTLKEYSAYRALKLELGENCYHMMIVTRLENNPVLLQKLYLPDKYFPNFKKNYANYDKLYTFIEKENGYKIKHFHSTFSTINAKSEEALLLNIKTDDAIYYVRTIIMDEFDKAIGYICSYFPGEFSEFEVIAYAA